MNALFSSSNEIHFSFNSINNYIWAVVVPLHIPDVNYTTGEKYIISNPFPNATFKFFPKYNGWDKKNCNTLLCWNSRKYITVSYVILTTLFIYWLLLNGFSQWWNGYFFASATVYRASQQQQAVSNLSANTGKTFYFAKNSRVWRDPRRLSISMGLLKSLVTFLWY